MTPTIEEWLADPTQVGYKIHPEEQFSPNLNILENIIIFYPKKNIILQRQKIEFPSIKDDIILLKIHPFPLSCIIPSLKIKNCNIDISLTMTLFLDVESPKSLQTFCNVFFKENKKNNSVSKTVDSASIFEKVYSNFFSILQKIVLKYEQEKLANSTIQAKVQQKFMSEISGYLEKIGLGSSRLTAFVIDGVIPPKSLSNIIFLSENSASGGSGAPESALAATLSEKIYWASSTRFYSLDIKQQEQILNFHQAFEYPQYKSFDLAIAELGSIRSIKLLNIEEKLTLTIGLMRGIIVWHPNTPRIFRYTQSQESTQGYNSIAYYNPFLYATHSEYGLIRWDIREQPSKGENILAKLLNKSRTIRAIQCLGEDLYFANNEKVFVVPAHSPQKSNSKIYLGNASEITSLVATEEGIYAGNSQGEVLFWDKNNTKTPQICAKYSHPIFMLRRNSSTQDILIAAKEPALLAINPHSHKVKRYLADQLISWIDGASNILIGIGEDLETIYVWENKNTEIYSAKINVPERIHDVLLFFDKKLAL